MRGFSHLFDDALAFAACAHRTQKRKGTPDPGVPYIVHPVHVATILMRHGFDEPLVIAGLLHDTVEDCDVALGDIQSRFGDAVARLVSAMSEQKTNGEGARRPWRDRKLEAVAKLRAGDEQLAALKAADALHNASCTVVDLERDGAAVWARFNAGPSDTVWYYGEILRVASEKLGDDHALVRELADTVAALAARA